MALSPALIAELDAFLVELNAASAAAILPLFRADHGLEDKGLAGPPGTDAHAQELPVVMSRLVARR